MSPDQLLYAEARRAIQAFLYRDPVEHVNAQCRRWRREKGITVKDIADKLGSGGGLSRRRARSWARHLVRHVEHGDPRQSELRRYAWACGLMVDHHIEPIGAAA